jgi:long-chain fatty acid transport protein
LSATAAHGASFRIISQSASASGQSGAFVAQADDPSALYFNPAGMTQLRRLQIAIGTTLFGGSTSFQSPTGAAARGDFGSSVAYPPPSQIFVTANLGDLGIRPLKNLTAGIGVVFPFGTRYRWPDNGPFATAVTQAALQPLDIKPTLAYKFNDQLSVGLGLDIYTFTGLIGEGHYEQKLNASPALAGFGIPSGTPLEINGKDTALGFNASFLYTPLRNADGKPLVNIGFIYRSQATLHLDGQFLVNGALASNASTTLVLPQVFTGGIAVWPIRNQDREWKLELDVDYTGWKSVRNLDVHLPTTTIPFPENWRSTYTVMIGTEYRWLKLARLPQWEVAARAGYWNAQTPIPDSSFNPAVPDSDNHSISVGLGLLCKAGGKFFGVLPCGSDSTYSPKAVGLDLAYQALLYETRTVSNNQNTLANPLGGPNSPVNGTYKSTFHVGIVTLRVNF